MVERKKTNLRKARAAVSAHFATSRPCTYCVRREPGSSGKIYRTNVSVIFGLIVDYVAPPFIRYQARTCVLRSDKASFEHSTPN